MIKKLITAVSVIALSCSILGCKSDEEKCREDHDLEACQKVLKKELEEFDKTMDKAKKELDQAIGKARSSLGNSDFPEDCVDSEGQYVGDETCARLMGAPE